MQKLFASFTIIAALSTSAFAQLSYTLSVTESRLRWKGSHMLGAGAHEGTIQLLTGSLSMSPDNNSASGGFTIDMTTIRGIDERTNGEIDELSRHLKSDDFFSTATYPVAAFSIRSAKRTSDASKNQFAVSGLLTIKGITNGITFPAEIVTSGQRAKVTGHVTIDRTLWGVNYQSSNFFALAKDETIANEINVWIELELTAASPRKSK